MICSAQFCRIMYVCVCVRVCREGGVWGVFEYYSSQKNLNTRDRFHFGDTQEQTVNSL